jgi:hypothetical protein
MLISIATFPGVIFHELGHLLFCRIRKVPVLDACFFQFDNRVAGYVVHEEPRSFLSTFLITVGPFIVNTLACLLICIPAAIPYELFGDRSLMTYFYLWLGISIGMHAFPSNQDAAILWRRTLEEVGRKNFLAYLCMPVVGLVYLANLLSMFWFDAVYGFCIGVVLPKMIVTMLL